MNRKSNPTNPCALACLAALAIVVGPAHAAPATIANFSFEANVNPNIEGRFAFGESRDFNPDGSLGTADAGGPDNIVGWTTVTTENTMIPDGAEISVGFFQIAPADGFQALALVSGASTRQFTSTAWSSLTVGDQITLTVAIGDRTTTTTWADESYFALIDADTTGTLAAGTLLSSTVAHSGSLTTPFAGGLGIDGGTMQDRSFTYTVVAGDLLRTGNVGVLLAGFGSTGTGNGLNNNVNQAFFDNVRLDISAGSGGGGAPQVTSITKSGSTFTVQFEGIDGETYDLNKSTTLDFTTPDVKDTVTLTGTTTGNLEDNTASESAAFYRVEQQ